MVPLPLLGRSLSFLDTGDEVSSSVDERNVVPRCLPICLSISREQLGQERAVTLLLVLLFSSSIRSPSPVISLVQLVIERAKAKKGNRRTRGTGQKVPSFRRSFLHQGRIGENRKAELGVDRVTKRPNRAAWALFSMEGCDRRFETTGAPRGTREFKKERNVRVCERESKR